MVFCPSQNYRVEHLGGSVVANLLFGGSSFSIKIVNSDAKKYIK